MKVFFPSSLSIQMLVHVSVKTFFYCLQIMGMQILMTICLFLLYQLLLMINMQKLMQQQVQVRSKKIQKKISVPRCTNGATQGAERQNA